MTKGKPVVALSIIAAVLLFLLLVIGALAFVFFDALVQPSVQREPFVSVSTGIVQRITMRAPEAHEEIVLSVEEKDHEVTAVDTESAWKPSEQLGAAAVCMHYGDTITGRTAWRNPVEFTASFSSHRVVVQIISPVDYKDDTP